MLISFKVAFLGALVVGLYDRPSITVSRTQLR